MFRQAHEVAPGGFGPRNMVGAWASIIGAATAGLRTSFNVGSLTDNGTGDWTLTFLRAFDTANYVVCGINKDAAGAFQSVRASTVTAPATTSVRVVSYADLAPTQLDSDPTTVMCVGSY